MIAAIPRVIEPLVEYLEKEMALSGVPMAEGENDIILTGGFQRALALVLDTDSSRPGQKVAIESPTFTGLLNLLIAKQIEFVPIPMDEEGMDTDYLECLSQGRGPGDHYDPDLPQPDRHHDEPGAPRASAQAAGKAPRTDY